MSHRIPHHLACVLLAGACLVMSCGGETGMNPPVEPPPPACADVTLTVSSGTSPTFSWDAGCAVGRLIVEQGAVEVWGSETAGTNTYVSPIQYDVHPPDATEPEPALPLVAGTSYTVTIFRWYSVTPESLEVIASEEFTP